MMTRTHNYTARGRALQSLLIAAMLLSSAASYALERCECAPEGAPPQPAGQAAGAECCAAGAGPAAFPACCRAAAENTLARGRCAVECNHLLSPGDDTYTMETRNQAGREQCSRQTDRSEDAPRRRAEPVETWFVFNLNVPSTPRHIPSTVLLI